MRRQWGRVTQSTIRFANSFSQNREQEIYFADPENTEVQFSQNLIHALDRLTKAEEYYRNEINAVITKAAGALAFLGVIVIGVFTAISQISWGFAQVDSELKVLMVFLPNVCFAILVWYFLVHSIIILGQILRRAKISLPWEEKLKDPDALLERDPDTVTMEVIDAIRYANEENEVELKRLNDLLLQSLLGLAIVSISLMLQAGYNGSMKTFLEDKHYLSIKNKGVLINVPRK